MWLSTLEGVSFAIDFVAFAAVGVALCCCCGLFTRCCRRKDKHVEDIERRPRRAPESPRPPCPVVLVTPSAPSPPISPTQILLELDRLME